MQDGFYSRRLDVGSGTEVTHYDRIKDFAKYPSSSLNETGSCLPSCWAPRPTSRWMVGSVRRLLPEHRAVWHSTFFINSLAPGTARIARARITATTLCSPSSRWARGAQQPPLLPGLHVRLPLVADRHHLCVLKMLSFVGIVGISVAPGERGRRRARVEPRAPARRAQGAVEAPRPHNLGAGGAGVPSLRGPPTRLGRSGPSRPPPPRDVRRGETSRGSAFDALLRDLVSESLVVVGMGGSAGQVGLAGRPGRSASTCWRSLGRATGRHHATASFPSRRGDCARVALSPRRCRASPVEAALRQAGRDRHPGLSRPAASAP